MPALQAGKLCSRDDDAGSSHSRLHRDLTRAEVASYQLHYPLPLVSLLMWLHQPWHHLLTEGIGSMRGLLKAHKGRTNCLQQEEGQRTSDSPQQWQHWEPRHCQLQHQTPCWHQQRNRHGQPYHCHEVRLHWHRWNSHQLHRPLSNQQQQLLPRQIRKLQWQHHHLCYHVRSLSVPLAPLQLLLTWLLMDPPEHRPPPRQLSPARWWPATTWRTPLLTWRPRRRPAPCQPCQP